MATSALSASRPKGSSCLRLEMGPGWQFVNHVRRFAEAMCLECRVDEDSSSAVGMAVHELVQNAVKYSPDGWVSVSLDVDAQSRRVSVQVQNRISPSAARELEPRVARLRDARDALDHYLELMQETSLRSDGSGLGLARIRAEGQMTLDIDIGDAHVVIRAVREATFADGPSKSPRQPEKGQPL